MKDRLFSIEAVHAEYQPYRVSNSKVTLQQKNFSKSSDVQIKKDEKVNNSLLVSTHPATQHKSHFISLTSIQSFNGITKQESSPLFLFF
ncbi:MAG: hypothetical protein CMP14_05745 [Rickettsiales bacterium]|nr:hypothetical protein [Rickettsiales bacterium]|tara:strand:- start:125 stop:391 length:267 start_codon:yes stop_codon:yes gene_type:complete